jgi:heptosyltransferase-2
MGDSVLIRLLIECIKDKYPKVEIGVMAGAATCEFMTIGASFRVHTYVQRNLSVRFAFRTWRGVRRCKYDGILNFEQGSIAGTAFLASLGIPSHVGFVIHSNDPKRLLLTHSVPFREHRSMWQSFIGLARVLYPDLPESLPAAPLFCSPDAIRWIDEWWSNCVGDAVRNTVAIHVGCAAGMDFKRWPVERFVALGERIKSRWEDSVILLTGTSSESALIRDFRKRYSGRSVDASNLGSIERTAVLLKRCQILVSNDTGVMHLGAAVGTPTVGLFGPTSPEHWAPVGKRATFVRETHVECSPCVNNYTNTMPSQCKHQVKSACMADIRVETVLCAITRVINLS